MAGKEATTKLSSGWQLDGLGGVECTSRHLCARAAFQPRDSFFRFPLSTDPIENEAWANSAFDAVSQDAKTRVHRPKATSGLARAAEWRLPRLSAARRQNFPETSI